jgi:hypothetical protein
MSDSDPGTQVLLERLANVTADLLSQRRYTPFLRRLLSVERGEWRPVCELCEGMGTLSADAAAAFEACGDRFAVTHLAWPGLPEGDPGCMVLFCYPDELWTL